MKRLCSILLFLASLMLSPAMQGQIYHSLPYYEVFDSVPPGDILPMGWMNYSGDTTSTGVYPSVATNASYAYWGNSYLMFEGSNHAVEVCAMHEFEDVSNLQLDFFYCIKGNRTPGLFEIGVMEGTLFVPVDTVDFRTSTNFGTYYRYHLLLDTYTGSGHSIAFRVSKPNSVLPYTVLIDFVKVEEIPSCMYPPGSPTISDVTSHTATLTWGAASVSEGYGIDLNGTHYATADTSFVFTDLAINTYYSGYLYNICHSGDRSERRYFSFHTDCGNGELPFREDFENVENDFPFCWHRVISHSVGATSYPYIAHTGVRNNSRALMFTYSTQKVAGPLLMAPANELEVTGWISGEAGSPIVVGFLSGLDSGGIFYPVDTVYSTPDYRQFFVSFEGIGLTDTGYVAFYSYANDYNYCYLDDVLFRRRGECPTPRGLKAIGTHNGSVTLCWHGSGASRWQVAYGVQGFDPDTAVANVLGPLAVDTVVVTGLDNEVVYEFYVRSVCDSLFGNWSIPVKKQPNVFEMVADSMVTVRICSGRITDDGGLHENYRNRQTSYMVVYPEGEGRWVSLSGTTHLIDDGGNNVPTLTVYDGADTTGPVLGTFVGTNNVLVNSITGPLTLKMHSNVRYSNSDTGFDLTVYCHSQDECPDPFGVSVSHVAGASAQVEWDSWPYSAPDYWEIELRDTASGVLHRYIAPDSVRSFLVGGLSQTTYYEVRLREACLSGDTSGWVGTSFITFCFADGETQVGHDSYYVHDVPFNTYYNYSYSQMLFRNAELGDVGDTVRGLKFMASDVTDGEFDIDIYIDTTSLTEYTYSGAALPMDSSRRFFSGAVQVQLGENLFLFDRPFVRPNEGENLVVTVDNHSGHYRDGVIWRGVDCPYYVSKYQYSDNVHVDPAYPSAYLTIVSYDHRPSVIFLTDCGYPRCVPPNVSAEVGTTHVTLNWAAGRDETLWTVEYKLTADTVWTLAEASTPNTSAMVTGLRPNRSYDFRVGSLCGDTTVYSYIQVHLNCSIITDDLLPLEEDFEEFLAESSRSEMEPCWNRITTMGFGYYQYPQVSTYHAHSGNRSLFCEGSYLVLPEMDVDARSLALSCYVDPYSNNAVATIVAGVMTDPTDETTFQPVDTAQAGPQPGWQYIQLMLDRYTGAGRYVALYGTTSYFYLDDLTLRQIPECSMVEVESVRADSTHTVIVSFADTSAPGNYTICWGPTADISAATDSATFNTVPALLTGMPDSTYFFAWIRNNCATCRSLWNPIGRFRTYCPPVVVTPTAPFTEGFEGGLCDCYTQERPDAPQHIVYDWEASGDNYDMYPPLIPHSDSLMAFCTQIYSASRLIMPTFDFAALGHGAELNFWHKGRVYVYVRNNDTAEWTLVSSHLESFSSSWTEGFVSLPFSVGAPFYQVAFVAPGRTVLDDITISAAPACHRPDSLTAVATDISAFLTWTGNAPAYEVEFRGSSAGAMNYYTTSADSLSLVALTPTTSYEYRVRGICAVGDSSRWSDWFSFTTAMCPAAIVYASSDSTALPGTKPDGPMGNASYRYSYVQTLVDSAALAGLHGDISALAFRTYSGNGGDGFGDVDVYMANVPEWSLLWGFVHPDDDHHFVKVMSSADLTFDNQGWHIYSFDTLFAWDGHSNILVSVNRRQTAGSSVAASFYTHNTSFCKTRSVSNQSSPYDVATVTGGYAEQYAGDLQFWVCGGSCDAPEVTNVVFDDRTATVSWTGTAPDSTYHVGIKASTATHWPAPVTVTDTTYTFTGLIPYVDYTIRVQQRCSDRVGDYSLWATSRFATAGVPCVTPSDFAISGVGSTSATFDWSANGNEAQWDLHLWSSEGHDTLCRLSTHPATIHGLRPGSRYLAAVRAVCGSDGSQGQYADPLPFYTPYCPPVFGLSVTDVQAFNVTLAWQADTSAQQWEIEYGPRGFAHGTGLTEHSSASTYTVYGLSERTDYDFYVRTVCGPDFTSTTWAKVSATTTTAPAERHTVTVLTSDGTMGTAQGSGVYRYGELATVTAFPNENFMFYRWSNGVEDNPYRFVVTEDVTLVANFLPADGIADGDDRFVFTLTPNPASGTTDLMVRGLSGRVRIAVMDMNGRCVDTQTLDVSGDCRKTIDLQGMAPGAYFVTVTGDKTSLVRKLIVK